MVAAAQICGFFFGIKLSYRAFSSLVAEFVGD
jgi:hypothetical protein